MSPVRWIVLLVAAVLVSVLAATGNTPLLAQPLLHRVIVGAIMLSFVFLAVQTRLRRIETGASESAIGASTAEYLGLVWSWGALSILLTYVFVLETHWPEWWQFFLGFTAAAVGSLAFAALLGRDAAAGKVDDTLIKIGRFLVQLQIAGMVVGIVTMIIDGKFPRAITQADWAGCNICFFGALAIIAIGADALRRPKDRVIQS